MAGLGAGTRAPSEIILRRQGSVNTTGRSRQLRNGGGLGVLRFGERTVTLARMVIEGTAIFQKVPEGYVAFLAELPGANSQGATLDEARANLAEAVELIVSSQRMLLEERLGKQEVVRERMTITGA